MNKTIAIKNHLEEIGHITSMEAIQKYGATRLSSIIYRLRHKYGMKIGNKSNRIQDRYGHLCIYDTYFLIKK